MSWNKLPAIGGKYGGCLNCGPRPNEFPMNASIGVGFGDAGINRDGERVWSEPYHPDDPGPVLTGKDAEEMASKDPDHDWRIVLNGPMSGRTYQRHEAGKWLLVYQNQGFA